MSDRVLREVSKEETAADIWAKLESLYMAKSLTNHLHLKHKLFTFKISEGKNILEQLEEFGKCVDDLEMIDEKLKDEDKALILLNSLPTCYEQFKDAILLGRDSKITYEEVYSALKLKEIQRSNSKPTDQAAEVLNVKIDILRNLERRRGRRSPGRINLEKERKLDHAIIVRSPDTSRKIAMHSRESWLRNKRLKTQLILQSILRLLK